MTFSRGKTESLLPNEDLAKRRRDLSDFIEATRRI